MFGRTESVRWALGLSAVLGLGILLADAAPASADRGRSSRSRYSRRCDDGRRSSSYYRRASWGDSRRYAFDRGRDWRRSRWDRDDNCDRRGNRYGWSNSPRGWAYGRSARWR